MTTADQPPPCAGGTSVPFSRAEGLESLGQFRSVEIQASGNISVSSGSSGSQIWLYLGGCYAEGAYVLIGTWFGDSYWGTWSQSGIVLLPIGTFSLFKY